MCGKHRTLQLHVDRFVLLPQDNTDSDDLRKQLVESVACDAMGSSALAEQLVPESNITEVEIKGRLVPFLLTFGFAFEFRNLVFGKDKCGKAPTRGECVDRCIFVLGVAATSVILGAARFHARNAIHEISIPITTINQRDPIHLVAFDWQRQFQMNMQLV